MFLASLERVEMEWILLLDSAKPGSHLRSLILFHVLCEEAEAGPKLTT